MRTIARAALPITVLALAGCGGAPQATPGAISVDSGDKTCNVSRTSAKAGTITFQVRNSGSQVTEFYLLGKGDRVISEVENIGPGMTRDLVAQVPQGGEYTTACKPGMQGDGIRGKFTVTGSAAATTSPELSKAITDYKAYVQQQAEKFKADTTAFTQAVKAGDVQRAKRLYPEARTSWERIEPVAESFGDLDPKIDGREADLEPGQAFTGYHRLEKDLWVTGPQPDTPAVADQLNADVDQLVSQVGSVELTPAKVANGAKELLDEVATTKVTGEEEAFSHTDLWDFQANVDGAKQVVESLRPALQTRDPKLLATLDEQFNAVNSLLNRYRVGDGFKFYPELTPDQVHELATAVDGLSEPLSEIAGVVAR